MLAKTHAGRPDRRAADDVHAVGIQHRQRADRRLDGDRHRPVPGGLVQLDRERRRRRLELRDRRADADLLAQRRAGGGRRVPADPRRCDRRRSGAGDDRQHRDRVGRRLGRPAPATAGGERSGGRLDHEDGEPLDLFSGDTVTFTLNVQNAGPSSAQNVTVSDPIDPRRSATSTVDTTPGNAVTRPSLARWARSPPTATVTITITATVAARDTTLTEHAQARRARPPTPTPSNNTASASVTVHGTADLAIQKSSSTANPQQGGDDTLHADGGQQRA